jgi:hypothetical protein
MNMNKKVKIKSKRESENKTEKKLRLIFEMFTLQIDQTADSNSLFLP